MLYQAIPYFTPSLSKPPPPIILRNLQNRLQILRLHPLPQTPLPTPLLLLPKPLLRALNPPRENLIQQRIVPLHNPLISPRMLPHVPEAREILPDRHRRGVLQVAVVACGGCSCFREDAVGPVLVKRGVDVLRGLAGYGREGLSELGVGDVGGGDFEVHAIGAVGVVEEPAGVDAAV
jgi:hypothetical protein